MKEDTHAPAHHQGVDEILAHHLVDEIHDHHHEEDEILHLDKDMSMIAVVAIEEISTKKAMVAIKSFSGVDLKIITKWKKSQSKRWNPILVSLEN